MRLAADARIPAIYQGDYFVALGGLASYGPDINALIRQSADYIDKILRGAPLAICRLSSPRDSF
jgi:putative tryptophan/tyrosine transport system substrate-binding protein